MNEGLIIKYLRQERKLSQNDVAQGICTVRHLRNIEKGVSTPTYDIICKLTERLGGDLHLMVNPDIQKYGLDLFKRIRRIEFLFREWNYNDLSNRVEELLSDTEVILSSSLYKKLKYYQAICLKENKNDYLKARQILLELIECKTNQEIIEYLDQSLRGELEINICNAIAVNEAYHGYLNNALEIFQAIRSNIIKYDVVLVRYLIKVTYNIAKLSYDQGKYEDAIINAKENIVLCKRERYVPFFGSTYMYLANSLKKLGYANSDYSPYYKKFLYLGMFFGDDDKIENAKNKIMQDNFILLDQDIEAAEV